MQITDVLDQMGGLESMARELGISEEQARRGAEVLAPALLGGFKKQARAQPSGLEGLGGLLGRLGGGGLLDEVLAPKPTDVARGNDVLGEIFGSKDVSRTVAKGASAKTGLDPALLKKMLPILAMMVAGYLAKHRGTGAQAPVPGGRSGGGLGGMLGRMLGGKGTAGGAGGLGSILDLDGDGNALDDILEMAGKALR